MRTLNDNGHEMLLIFSHDEELGNRQAVFFAAAMFRQEPARRVSTRAPHRDQGHVLAGLFHFLVVLGEGLLHHLPDAATGDITSDTAARPLPWTVMSLLILILKPKSPPLPPPLPSSASSTHACADSSTSARYLPIQLLSVVHGSLLHLLDAWVVPRNQGHAAVPDRPLLCCLQGKGNQVRQRLIQPFGKIMAKTNERRIVWRVFVAVAASREE